MRICRGSFRIRLTPAILTLLIFASIAHQGICSDSYTLARSRIIRGGEAAREISVDVSDVEILELIATGYSWGQAVWGEPVLVDGNGDVHPLTKLKPLSFKVGWGEFTTDKGPDGQILKVANREFGHGLFAHADSRVVYRLDGRYVRFKSWIGINHTAETRGDVIFEVRDGKDYELRVRGDRAAKIFSINVLRELRIILGRSSVPEAMDQLAQYEKNAESILEGISKLSPESIKKAEEFEAFARETYLATLDAPLLFVKRNEYWAGHIYDDYLTWHPGGGIYVIENPRAPIDKQVVRPLIDPTTPQTLGVGVYRDPEVSYDGHRVLFSFKGAPDGNTSIYEIGIDGKGLRRLTNPQEVCDCMEPQPGLIGTGHHDITPCYLPSGRIAFTSTRTGGHVMCFSSYIDILHTMNGDGSDLRCISVNQQNEFDPTVLPDGRVLYGRWEYVDKTALYMQSLWTVNPDGTNETALFANNLAKPTAILDARPVPESRLIVAALTPHNGQAVGAIAMIDPLAGKNSLAAITNFTPEYPTEMDQGLRRGPSDPWPLSKDLVLIANNAPEHGEHGVIELITRGGFRTVVYRDPDITCYSPMLLKPRPTPALLPSSIQLEKPGLFFVHDVYQGMEGMKRGEVKALRVIETTSRISGIPPGGRWWNQAFLASWQGSYDIKKILGVVPVELDGSAYFEAPGGKGLYFQALDADGRMIQSQRTFVQSVPGVTRSCMGCHVSEDNLAPVSRNNRPLALQKPPAQLQPESWGGGFVDYPTMIQPILDRRCVSCHGGDKGIEGGIDLSGGWTWAFNISYETLIKNTLTGFLNCNNASVHTSKILPPRSHGSGAAPLAQLLLGGHAGYIEGMTREEIGLILAWMDGNCNYHGTWDYSPYATCEAILSAGQQLLPAMDRAGCLNCHPSAIGNDWINLRNPERSRILRAPLAKEGSKMGLAWCRDRKARPLDLELVTQRDQPPDVAYPQRRPAPDPTGTVVTPFADTNDQSYQAMLAIIRSVRDTALEKARVDMPGAVVNRGRIRELPPLAPPLLSTKPATDSGAEPIAHAM